MAVEIPRQLAAKLDPLGPHFCLVEARGKSPEVGGKEWQKRPINADDPKLLQWLSGGGNYGVVGGFGLVIVDIDLDELKTIVKERLPPTFTSANILTVKVGTNTPRGGDAGHGGETVLTLIDEASTCWEVSVDGKCFSQPKSLEIRLLGDTEAETFFKALQFAVRVFKLQRER